MSSTGNTGIIEYQINKGVILQVRCHIFSNLQFKKCFLKRQTRNDVICLEGEQRRKIELDAYYKFKEIKENADLLYLVDQKWIERWINYLRAPQTESPDYIFNEKIYKMIYEENKANQLKMNEDFILVHKSLFEYLYGIYGCDYIIQAKQVVKTSVSIRGARSPNSGPS